MKNPIIENRLNRLMAIKKELLTKKKSERGNQLKQINQSIATLKRWNQDPKTHIPEPVEPPKKRSTMSDATHAVDAFRMALESFAGSQKKKTPDEIREMIQGNSRIKFAGMDEPISNGMDFGHAFIDESIVPAKKIWFQDQHGKIIDPEQIKNYKQPVFHITIGTPGSNTPTNEENPGNKRKTTPNVKKTHTKDNGWRQPVVEHVDSVIQRMNGNR